MHNQEVKNQVAGYLEKNAHGRENRLLQSIKHVFRQGRLDHNQIRKALIDCFKSQDKSAVIFGTLLLQLDNEEICQLLGEKMPE